MRELATDAWNPWIAWLLLGGGAVMLLATLLVPVRGLPRVVSALRDRTVTEGGRGPLWLALAAATGMGGITGSVLAIGTAGPGALVWMWIATLVGMAIAFAEGSLGARAPGDEEPATVHLLHAPWLGRLLAPMYAIAVVVMALVVGAAFQAHQAAAVLESTMGLPPRGVAIGLAVLAAPFVLLPRLRPPLFVIVPVALGLYVIAALSALSGGDGMLGLLLGDAVNQAFGVAPAVGGAAGGGVGLLVAHGVLRATMAGEAGLGSAALLDLRSRSRGSAGAVAMLVPLLASGVVGSLSGLLLLGAAGQDEPVAEPELVPLERAYAKGLRPSQQVGQTIVLPDDTTMEAGKHYAVRLRSNPRGHAHAKLVVPKDLDENTTLLPHVALPHYGIAHETATVVFHARDGERAEHAGWDVRIPCIREVKPVPGAPDGQEYLLLRPKDPELDMRKLAVRLDLLTQPYVVFDDYQFIGRVGRATSPDPEIGEHLAMFEAPNAERAYNPKLHEFFRMGFRGPYADEEGPRPPWGFVASEGYLPEIGSLVNLRISGDPRGNDVVDLTRSGSVEAPPWDFLLGARTLVLRHEDPAKDIRIPVTARYDEYRVRFDISDERFTDMRVVAKMEGYTGPFLVVPDYHFQAEVHGDERLPAEQKGRRVLVPLHPMGEVQGPYGDTDTYRPHPAELLDMGLSAPVLEYEGAQVVAARLSDGAGGFGRFAIILAVVVFALSTLVGWSELGGRAATAVFGSLGGPGLAVAMLVAAGVGTSWTLTELLPAVDLSIAAVAVPSMLGLLLMLPRIRAAAALKDDLVDKKRE